MDIESDNNNTFSSVPPSSCSLNMLDKSDSLLSSDLQHHNHLSSPNCYCQSSCNSSSNCLSSSEVSCKSSLILLNSSACGSESGIRVGAAAPAGATTKQMRKQEKVRKDSESSIMSCNGSTLVLFESPRTFYSHATFFDILVDLDSPTRFSLQNSMNKQSGGWLRGFDLLHKLKPIVIVEKKKKYVNFQIPEKQGINKDINRSISLLAYHNTPQHQELADLLRCLPPIIERYSIQIESVLSRQSDDLPRLFEIKSQRIAYIMNMVERNYFGATNGTNAESAKRTNNNKSPFINVAIFSVCFSNKSLHVSQLVKSKELIHLMGTDEDQVGRLALKRGKLDTFCFESRCIVQKNLIEFLVHGIEQSHTENFELLTYDNILVNCSADFHAMAVKFPAELEYDSEVALEDVVVVSHYNIEEFHLKKIRGIRSRMDDNDRITKNSDLDFEYSMQSEIFLQTFYAKSLRHIQRKQAAKERQETLIKSQTCRYRYIQHQPQSLEDYEQFKY